MIRLLSSSLRKSHPNLYDQNLLTHDKIWRAVKKNFQNFASRCRFARCVEWAPGVSNWIGAPNNHPLISHCPLCSKFWWTYINTRNVPPTALGDFWKVTLLRAVHLRCRRLWPLGRICLWHWVGEAAHQVSRRIYVNCRWLNRMISSCHDAETLDVSAPLHPFAFAILYICLCQPFFRHVLQTHSSV